MGRSQFVNWSHPCYKKVQKYMLLLLLYYILLILLKQFQYAGRVELSDFKACFPGQERHRTSILYSLEFLWDL